VTYTVRPLNTDLARSLHRIGDISDDQISVIPREDQRCRNRRGPITTLVHFVAYIMHSRHLNHIYVTTDEPHRLWFRARTRSRTNSTASSKAHGTKQLKQHRKAQRPPSNCTPAACTRREMQLNLKCKQDDESSILNI
jgi:hypothetical protein